MSRKVIGFDVRKGPLLRHNMPVVTLANYSPNDKMSMPPYPATISDHIWPRIDALDGNEEILNGARLMFDLQSHDIPDDSIVAAFTVSETDEKLLSDWRHCSTDTTERDLIAQGWTSIGWDVANPYFSGFYGFTWKLGELAQLFAGVDLTFNDYGLLPDGKLAEIAARFFDADMTQEAPFFPIQVLLRSIPVNIGVKP
jgi:hypothetical protein